MRRGSALEQGISQVIANATALLTRIRRGIEPRRQEGRLGEFHAGRV